MRRAEVTEIPGPDRMWMYQDSRPRQDVDVSRHGCSAVNGAGKQLGFHRTVENIKYPELGGARNKIHLLALHRTSQQSRAVPEEKKLLVERKTSPEP